MMPNMLVSGTPGQAPAAPPATSKSPPAPFEPVHLSTTLLDRPQHAGPRASILVMVGRAHGFMLATWPRYMSFGR